MKENYMITFYVSNFTNNTINDDQKIPDKNSKKRFALFVYNKN